jgi:hypothetical protein
MAEIPTKLTSLLWKCKTTDDVYETLRRERCLSPQAVAHRADAMVSIQQGELAWRREVADPGACGGTREWYVVGALMRGGYLNERARKFMEKLMVPGAKPWWRFWDRKR